MSPSPDQLSITVLGSSGTYPAADTACSGYLLRSGTTTVWLDCGSGTLANLQRHVELADVDGVVCTHSHPDHWTDLLLAINALRYGVNRPDARVPLHWTAETAAMFTEVSGRSPEPAFVPHVIDGSATARIGDISFRFARTDHPVETFAVRADAGGRSIAYSSDTGNAWDLSNLGSDIDLALIEATLDESDVDAVQHLTARQAGSQAARAGVAGLVLIHLAPGSDPAARMEDAKAEFSGPVALARTHERY